MQKFVRYVEFSYMAVARSCKIILFSGMTFTGYSINMETVAVTTEESPSLRRFKSLATEAKVNVIFWGLPC